MDQEMGAIRGGGGGAVDEAGGGVGAVGGAGGRAGAGAVRNCGGLGFLPR